MLAGFQQEGFAHPASTSHSEAFPWPSLFFAAPSSPSPPLDGIQDRRATDNSPAAQAKVTIIIKTQVGIETRHGKISIRGWTKKKKNKKGKKRENWC